MIHPRNLFSATGADLIFYKLVSNGVLYVLKFKGDNEKQHTTVNNHIMQLDETLKLKDGVETTFFLSINDDDSLPGSKVLSFDREGRKSSPLYRQLFGRSDILLPGVNVWSKVIEDAAGLSDDNVDDLISGLSEDEEVATGSVPGSSSNGKQRATPKDQLSAAVANAGSVSDAEKVGLRLLWIFPLVYLF